jgi:signal transduction histidine kinase
MEWSLLYELGRPPGRPGGDRSVMVNFVTMSGSRAAELPETFSASGPPALHPSGAFTHSVQFYESDQTLGRAIGEFLAAGLKAGQPTLVVATGAHRAAFVHHLATHGFDIERLCREGRLELLDAKETLSTFMVDAQPDGDRFLDCVGGTIADMASRRHGRPEPVLVYGEMVDLLWQDGQADAAIRLEDLWNALAAKYEFSLRCSYAMDRFPLGADASPFQTICSQHTHVIPAESYTQAIDDDARTRQIALLQQRARALEAEIAQRKDTERHLLAAKAEAEAANRMKDEFLAVLSHELRTPLNAIVGWTHIAEDALSDPPMVRRAIEVIERNVAAQARLVDDLLDVSRIGLGQMMLNVEPADLTEVLSASIDTIRPAVIGKAITLDLPAEGRAFMVRGDRNRLQQILWNVLSNAVKFSHTNGVIEVRQHEADGYVAVVIRDHGRGIEAAFLPHVFDRFRQEDSETRRPQSGLGLGLTLVRYLVEAHGGTVSAASAGRGCGATFTVKLPLFQDS